jgi:hypothetical protein
MPKASPGPSQPLCEPARHTLDAGAGPIGGLARSTALAYRTIASYALDPDNLSDSAWFWGEPPSLRERRHPKVPTADAELSRHLDRVRLAPGFSYSEQFAGTNGIGTALERGGPMHVFGHEHYAEDLEDLACAGVPIKHPISGKTVGDIDLTCWRKDAGSLLITLAKTTADQIRAALLRDSSAREQELLQEYLLAGRRSGDMVLAVNDDLLLMNASGARPHRDRGDRRVCLPMAGTGRV